MKYRFILIILSIVVILAALYVDLFMIEAPLLSEDRPNFEVPYLLRAMLIVVSSWLFVSGIKGKGESNTVQDDEEYKLSKPSWGVLTIRTETPGEREIFSISVKEVIVWAILMMSLFFLWVFLTRPDSFNRLGSEGRLVENLSALLCLVASFTFAWATLKLYRAYGRSRPLYIAGTAVLGLVLFVIGMEEVSWFQRVLLIETPESFSDNIQKEMNIHNFETNYFENAYYFSTFILLVLIPFVSKHTGINRKYHLFSFFMPSIFILYASAIFVAYNYDMWNVVLTQASFFVTLFILLYLALETNWDKTRLLSYCLLIVFLATQVMFIVYGKRLVRLWDITEYKELFIPVGLFLYSIEILHKTVRMKTFEQLHKRVTSTNLEI